MPRRRHVVSRVGRSLCSKYDGKIERAYCEARYNPLVEPGELDIAPVDDAQTEDVPIDDAPIEGAPIEDRRSSPAEAPMSDDLFD